jgi:hypothetical protein
MRAQRKPGPSPVSDELYLDKAFTDQCELVHQAALPFDVQFFDVDEDPDDLRIQPVGPSAQWPVSCHAGRARLRSRAGISAGLVQRG